MKKIMLFLTLALFSSSCFSQTFREAILNADVVVMGKLTISEKAGLAESDYRILAESSILVDKYLKGKGPQKLGVASYSSNTPPEPGSIEFDCVISYADGSSTAIVGKCLYCLRKLGDSYAVIYKMPYTAGSDKEALVEQQAQLLLTAVGEKEERKRFEKTVSWMVESYCCGLLGLELSSSKNSHFSEYYKAKGYITNPIDALSEGQIQQLCSYLLTKNSWSHYDTDVVRMAIAVVPKKELEQHLVELLKDGADKASISVWDVEQLLEALTLVGSVAAKEVLSTAVSSAVYGCENAIIQEIAQKICRQ